MIKDYGATLKKALKGKPTSDLQIYSDTDMPILLKKYGLSEMHATNFNILNCIVFHKLCEAEQLWVQYRPTTTLIAPHHDVMPWVSTKNSAGKKYTPDELIKRDNIIRMVQLRFIKDYNIRFELHSCDISFNLVDDECKS